MMGFQVFDPATNYYPHNLTITSKNITLQSLAYLQRGNFSLSAFQDSVFEPPPLVLYTKFSSEIYFLAFWGIIMIQCLAIMYSAKQQAQSKSDVWSTELFRLSIGHSHTFDSIAECTQNAHIEEADGQLAATAAYQDTYFDAAITGVAPMNERRSALSPRRLTWSQN